MSIHSLIAKSAGAKNGFRGTDPVSGSRVSLVANKPILSGSLADITAGMKNGAKASSSLDAGTAGAKVTSSADVNSDKAMAIAQSLFTGDAIVEPANS